MRPVVGVVAELAALAAVLGLGFLILPGWTFVFYIIVAQLLATYLVHCPAHYFFGRAVGIEFSNIRLGHTTLSKALPPKLSRAARLLPVLTLSVSKPSLSRVPKPRVSGMYLSGTIASVGIALVVAAVVTPGGSLPLVSASWTVAIGYLLFDLVFSPKSGDLMRARRAMGS